MLTQKELKSQLHYNPDTGLFIRNKALCNSVKIGDVAGAPDGKGYLRISVNMKRHKAHRLAWLYMTGELPKNQIDHINGVKNDNRFINLREATNSQNKSNSGLYVNNKSGYKGVSWYKKYKKWVSHVSVNGKRKTLGYFDNAIDASIAYENFAKQHHGEFYYCKD
jgi:hypothetical protein